jgi:hypothetical protein
MSAATNLAADSQIGVLANHAAVNNHSVVRGSFGLRDLLIQWLSMHVPSKGRSRRQRNRENRKDQPRVE